MAGDDVSIEFGPEGVNRILDAFKSVEEHAQRAARAQVQAASQVADAEVAAELKKQAIRNAAREAVRSASAAEKDAKRKAAQEAADAEISEVRRVVDAHRKAAKEKLEAQRYAAEYEKITGMGDGRPRGVFQQAAQSVAGMGANEASRLRKVWDDFDVVSSTASAALGLFKSGLDMATTALTQLGQMLISDVVIPQAKLQTTAAQLANRLEDVAPDQVQATLNAMASQFAAFKPEEIQKTFGQAVDQTKSFADAQQVATLSLKMGEAFNMDPTKLAEVIGSKRREHSELGNDQFAAMISAELGKTLKGGIRFDELARYADTIEGYTSKIAAPTPEAKAANDIAVTALIAKGSEHMKGMKAAGGVGALLKDVEGLTGKDKVEQLHLAIPALVASVGGDISKLGTKYGAAGQPLGGVKVGKLSGASVEFLRQIGVGDVVAKAEAEKKGSGLEAATKYLEEIMSGAAGSADKVQKAFDSVDSTPMVSFNRTVEEAKAALYPLANEVLQKLVPILQTEGPKLVAAISNLAAGINADDVVAALKGAAAAIATVAYYAMDLTGLGGASGKAAMAKLAGIGLEGTTDKKADVAKQIEADEKLHPEKYKVGIGTQILTGSFGHAGQSSLAGGGGSAGFGGGIDVGALVAAAKNLNDASASLKSTADKMDAADPARFSSAANLPKQP